MVRTSGPSSVRPLEVARQDAHEPGQSGLAPLTAVPTVAAYDESEDIDPDDLGRAEHESQSSRPSEKAVAAPIDHDEFEGGDGDEFELPSPSATSDVPPVEYPANVQSSVGGGGDAFEATSTLGQLQARLASRPSIPVDDEFASPHASDIVRRRVRGILLPPEMQYPRGRQPARSAGEKCLGSTAVATTAPRSSALAASHNTLRSTNADGFQYRPSFPDG